jgi:Leucine Rich repeats (2 copies)
MSPEEEAHEESLRRIREAERTGSRELDLSGWKVGKNTKLKALTRLPQELSRFKSLRSLDLANCYQLSGDLSPLAGLTSLQSLSLYGCAQLGGDLSPLAGLISLQSLNLARCAQLTGDLSPLAGLISFLSLDLTMCLQLRDSSPLAGLISLRSLWKQLTLAP